MTSSPHMIRFLPRLLVLLLGVATLLPAFDLGSLMEGDDSAEPAPNPGPTPDLVILANGQRLEGRLDTLPQEDAKQIHLLTTQGGRVSLHASLISSVRPSLDSRLDQLDTLGREEILELTRYCLVENRRAEALRCLRRAHAETPLQLPHLRLLARLIDEIEGQSRPEATMEAWNLYKLCKRAGDHSPFVISRLAELAEAHADWQAQRAEILARANELAPIRDGLEIDPNWRPENPKFANRCTSEVVIQSNGPREHRLREVRFEGGDEYKAALVLTKKFAIGDKRRFSFWALNQTDAALVFSLAVKTGPNYIYFESLPSSIDQSERWTQVSFDLFSQDFKSEATNWKRGTTIADVQDIREIQIQIHNQRRSGSVLLDGIAFNSLTGL